MENKQKASTINRRLAALSTFYAWAIEKKFAVDDPTRNIHGLGQQIIAPKALSEQAVNKIIVNLRGSEHYTALSALYYSLDYNSHNYNNFRKYQ